MNPATQAEILFVRNMGNWRPVGRDNRPSIMLKLSLLERYAASMRYRCDWDGIDPAKVSLAIYERERQLKAQLAA